MDLTVKVSDDSSLKSSNSFVEISSDLSESSPQIPNSDTKSELPRYSGYCYPDYTYDPEAEAFYSLYNNSHEELIEKYVQCEKELWNTNLNLKESEEEIEKLKKELEIAQRKTETVADLETELRTKLQESEQKNEKLCAELEIAQGVADLETDLSDSNSKYDNLKNELDVNTGDLYVQISNLNAMLYHCQMSLSTVIINQQTEITRLLGNETFFESMIREMEDHLDNADTEKLQLQEKQFEFFESMIKEMEDHLEYSDAEKLQLQKKEFELQRQLNLLKIDLVNRSEHIEALKKESEMNEQGYEKLKEENVELERKIFALKMDLVVKGDDMDSLIHQSETNELRYDMLMEETCELRQEVEDLRGKVEELENIIEEQRNVILRKDEKSRGEIQKLQNRT